MTTMVEHTNPPRSVQAGTPLFKCRDVVDLVHRMMRRSTAAFNLAKNEGRFEDAERYAVRMRAAGTLLEEMQLKLTKFESAVPLDPVPAALNEEPEA